MALGTLRRCVMHLTILAARHSAVRLALADAPRNLRGSRCLIAGKTEDLSDHFEGSAFVAPARRKKPVIRSLSVGFALSRATFTVPVAANDDVSAFGGSANSFEFEAYAWYSENDSP